MRGDFVTLVESALSEQVITEGLNELADAFNLNSDQIKKILLNKIEGDVALMKDFYNLMGKAFNLPIKISGSNFQKFLKDVSASLFKLMFKTLDAKVQQKIIANLDQYKTNAASALYVLLFEQDESKQIFQIPEDIKRKYENNEEGLKDAILGVMKIETNRDELTA